MNWIPVGKLTWRCDDIREDYHAIVSPSGDDFRVEVFLCDRRLIAYKDLHPVDAMKIAKTYITKHGETKYEEQRSYAY